jgi:hypothetical protein
VPIQKSALQEFQARLVLHEQGEALLKKSIDEARRAGYVTSRKIRVGHWIRRRRWARER